jgi:mRNA interferase RelE/StbE
MKYKLVIPKFVLKILTSLQKEEKDRIFQKIIQIENNPNLLGSIKLKSFDSQYRVRVGDFRIRYFINYPENEILILDIAHRKDIYRTK